MLEEVKSDVLILLDCCSAGATNGDAKHGTKEVIAACGFETWTPGVGQHSFTKCLIDELKYLSTGPAFSASSLHSRILDRIKYWNPVYNAEQLLVQDSEGRYRDKERRKTPVYISLNKDSARRSIELMSFQASGPNNRKATSPSGNDGNTDALTDFLKESRYGHVEVTISIQVATGQILRPDNLVEWIKDVPLLAKAVKLHAVIPSFSTLLILSVPVATWNLLPDDFACSFVGFTTSPNLLVPTFYSNILNWMEKSDVSSGSDHSRLASSFTSYAPEPARDLPDLTGLDTKPAHSTRSSYLVSEIPKSDDGVVGIERGRSAQRNLQSLDRSTHDHALLERFHHQGNLRQKYAKHQQTTLEKGHADHNPTTGNIGLLSSSDAAVSVF